MDLDLAIGGVQLVILVIGIVEALKEFGVQGKTSRVAALVVAFVLAGTGIAISEALIVGQAAVWVELLVKSLAFALAAMGYFDFTTKRILANKCCP